MINKQKKICKVENCKRSYRAKGFCNTHLRRYNKYGEVNRSVYDKNNIIIEDNFAKIELYNNGGKVIDYAFIDIEDIDKIKDYKWYKRIDGYILSQMTNYNIRLHRLIMNAIEGQIVDHINRNPLDNRKQNLRFVSFIENCINQKKPKNNTTGIIGVSYSNRDKKWLAHITFNNLTKMYRFKNKEEAIQKRKELELLYGFNKIKLFE